MNETTCMPSYTITAMTPKRGGTHRLADGYLGKRVTIVSIAVGERGWLNVDCPPLNGGEYLHISTIENIAEDKDGEVITIITRNTVYVLKKNH